MKTNNIIKDELMGRTLLSLLVIAGITFSAISFFILDEEIQEIFSYTEVTPVPPNICENGLCYFKDAKETSNHMFVQLEEELSKTQKVLKNEEFTTLKLYIESNNHNWGDGQLINIRSFETDWQEGNGISAPVSNLLNPSDGVTWSCPTDS